MVTDIPEKRALPKGKYLLPVCQIFMEFHQRKCDKIHCVFAFCPYVAVIKY